MTSPLIPGFMQAAERDIGGIEHLLPNFPDLAAFHVQQAAEKLARAVCLHEGLPDLRTHDIVRIAERLPRNHRLRKKLINLGEFSAAATVWRYPNAAGKLPKPPSLRKIETAFVQIKIIRDEIRGMLSAPQARRTARREAP